MTIAKNEIIITDNVFKELETIAKAKNKPCKQVLEDIINKELKEISNKESEDKKLKENNETKEILTFKDMAGRYTTDKPFSAVEEVRKMRGKE